VGADEEFRTAMKEGNWLIKFNSIRIDSLSVRFESTWCNPFFGTLTRVKFLLSHCAIG